MSKYDKLDVDDEYTPEQLARFRKTITELNEHSADFGAWCDAGRIGPEPREPDYTPDEIFEARYWMTKRNGEMCRKYNEAKRLRAERGEPEPDDE